MRVRRSAKKRAHKVTLCTHAEPRSGGPGKGRSVSLFAFSWADLAALFGLKVPTVQKLAKRGAFDVTDLRSIAEYAAQRRLKIQGPQDAAAVDPPSGEFN